MFPAVRFVLCCAFFAVAAQAQQFAISPTTLPDGTVGLVYGTGATLSVNTGSGVDDWSVSAGSLPPRLFLVPPFQSSVPAVFCIPTPAGAYSFTIKGGDTHARLGATQAYTIKIAGAGLTSSPPP